MPQNKKLYLGTGKGLPAPKSRTKALSLAKERLTFTKNVMHNFGISTGIS
jgi:hypothetical protein